MVENALLYVFSLSNSLVFVSFLHSSDRSHTHEQTGNMPSTQAVAPSRSHNRDGSEKVRTFGKRPHRHKPFDRQRFVSVLQLWLRHTQLRNLLSVCIELLRSSARRQFAGARCQIRTGLYFFGSILCRFCSKFAWALPLSLSSPWTMNFFLTTDKYGSRNEN